MWTPYRLRRVKEIFTGTHEGRETTRQSTVHARNLSERIQTLKVRSEFEKETSTDIEEPIFVCSAGWRSGSTLLQRMLMANERVLIWGEPFDRSGIVQKLADMCRPFTFEWPSSNFIFENIGSNRILSEEWIANLYPSLSDFRGAHRDMLLRLFKEPAEKNGYEYWGLKEVRFSVAQAEYLQYIFPNAKFIFIVRNPVDAYKSYLPWRRWFKEWPERPVLTPFEFGRVWNEKVNDFVRNSHKVNGLLIRYEELEGRVKDIENLVGFKVSKPSMLERNKGTPGQENEIHGLEKFIINLITFQAQKKVGY
ncbi:sulfotransferase family protein [Rhodovibrio sodomensis]|nr:sulfotransferase [Rhodovibrio sodomensis]